MAKNKLDIHYSSVNETWETPKKFFDEYDAHHDFTIDVCASAENAKCKRFFTKEQDGLKQSWFGETCWCNPPYGRTITGLWVKKAFHESQVAGTSVVMLLPARTDTKWFHEYVYNKGAYGVQYEFIKGRIKFVGAEHGAPFPSMIVEFN